MRTADILQIANEEAPELMKEAALHLALIERVGPQFLPEVIEEFQKISHRVSEKTKEAGFFDGFGSGAKRVGVGTLQVAAGTVAAGIGLAVATDLYNSARKGLTKSRNYRRMMDANPDLKDMHAQKKDRFQSMFGVLQRHAPDMAADPIFAGAYMTRVMGEDDSRNSERHINDLLQSQKLKGDTRYEPFKGIKPVVPDAPEVPFSMPTTYELRENLPNRNSRTTKSTTKPW